MKRRAIICLLLAACLLGLCGCSEEFDASTAENYCVVNFDRNNLTLTNAKKQELHWLPMSFDLEGNMPYCDIGSYGLSTVCHFTVPYSKYFTSKTQISYGYNEFSVEFYKDREMQEAVYVWEKIDGETTIFEDETVKVKGSGPNVDVRYAFEEQGLTYILTFSGHGDEDMTFRREGDDVIAEGAVGEYTVEKCCITTSEDIFKKTYSEDGVLLKTEP